jgi:hypothetical protein
MSVGYFDSSALVKRYLAETGTSWVQAWCDDPDRTVAVGEIRLVEIAAAFASKLRGGFITQTAYRNARHPLRGYDAVHLACALRLNRALVAQHLPPLVFVCADNDLLSAAAAEGLAIENPNDYP